MTALRASKALRLDGYYQKKLGINGYPDPETFRDEWQRYTPENINQLFMVNKRLLNLLAKQEEPQYPLIGLSFQSSSKSLARANLLMQVSSVEKNP